MDAKTNYLEDAILNAVLRNISFTSPATVYVGLFTADPGEAGSLANEVSGGSYARVAVTFGAPASGTCANTGILTFPTATVSWGIVTHAAILDVATLLSGNILYKGALAASKTVDIGDTVSYAIGALTVSET
jgi:hypothetical protein